MTVTSARQLDAADPLARVPLPVRGGGRPVRRRLPGRQLARAAAGGDRRAAGRLRGRPWGRGLIRSWDESWMAEPVTVGDRLGEVVLGAAPGQVIVADSTTVLLYKLIRAAVGARPGRDEILIERANFPTDRFIVDGIAAECGLTVRLAQPRRTTPGCARPTSRRRVSERTALVVLSHVAYRSGSWPTWPPSPGPPTTPGALILWDLCHSAGALPVELDACDADLAAGCTYKYLNGGPGVARLRLRRHAAAGGTAPAGLGLDGRGRPVRDGAGATSRPRGSASSSPAPRRCWRCSRSRTCSS